MKQKLPIEMTENGIHYTLHGDYYFPDISATDSHPAMKYSLSDIDTLSQQKAMGKRRDLMHES